MNDLKVGFHETTANSVIDAVRSVLGLEVADGHIVHYWWKDRQCLVVFRYESTLWFMTVEGISPLEWSVHLERVDRDGYGEVSDET